MTREIQTVFGVLFAVLLVASAVGWWLRRTKPSRTVENLNARIRAWWVMILVGGAVLLLGRNAVVVFFALLSWFTLREFSAKYGWWFVAVPLQYAAVAVHWNWGAALVIPVLCLLPASREYRTGMLLCVYALSCVPLLERVEWMFYLVLIVQASDVLQYLWGRALGRHPVAPQISPAKTVEGTIGGILCATVLGAWLHYLTPFSPWGAMAAALAVTVAGFGSGLVFSAIKRRRGIKDWGTAIAGHGGVLDRVDSLCLSAPVFYAAVAVLAV